MIFHQPIRRRASLAVAAALGASLVLSSCAGNAASTGSGQQRSVSQTDGDGETLTVWIMQDDYNDETIAAINEEFTEQTGAEVDVQVQQWDGITTKISTALATSTPPDVLDLGNTQVASFAFNGGLMDLSDYREDLAQGQTWIDGLVDPAIVDEALYAVPGFAGNRAVVYNATMWAEAGVTEIPTTFDELTDALELVGAANSSPEFSPIYLPGEQWQAGVQFLWDAGGDFGTVEDGEWTGTLSTDESLEGLQAWKDFQNTYSSPASKTLDTETPPLYQVFADGRTSAIIASAGFKGRILEANPELTADDLGTFPLPSAESGTQPVFIGGSDWGVSAKSNHNDLALQWIKIAASPETQSDYVFGSNGWIPNSAEGIEAAQASLSSYQKGFFDAALTSKSTPAAANWATLEGDKSVNNLFASIASGSKSVEAAAADFDDHLEEVLNK